MNSHFKIRPLKPFALTLNSLSLAPSSTTSPFQTLVSTPKKSMPITNSNTLQFKPINKGGFSDFIQFSQTKPANHLATLNTDVRRASTGMHHPWESRIQYLRNETKIRNSPVAYNK